jgi:hypothetical protein
MTPDYGLPPEALQAMCCVLAAHPEVEAAILYGSRALGRQRLGRISTSPCRANGCSITIC